MTGQYDRKAEGQALTAANAARLARDPFANIAPDDDTEADPAGSASAVDADTPPGTCPNCGGTNLAGSTCLGCGHMLTVPELRVALGATYAEGTAEWTEYRCTGCGATYNALSFDRNPHTCPPAEAPAAEAAAVDLFKADWPYPVVSAADFAALYTAAAGHIKARGYYEYEVQGYADEPGISITGALKLAAFDFAQAADPADTHDQHVRAAQDLTEELETRLSAVLYVFGQIHSRTGIRDLSDMHVGWSLGHFDLGPNPSAAQAVALLEQAARMFAALEVVTVAPAPLAGTCPVHGGRSLSACDPAECPAAADAEAARTRM